MEVHLRNSILWVFKASLFGGLVTFLLAVSQSSLAAGNELVPTAIAIDLLLTVPVVYFLLIRRSAVPRITVVPVFLLCFFIGSTVLPYGLGVMGVLGTIVIPAVEIVLLGFLGVRIFRARRAYAEQEHSQLDLMENLRTAFERELKPAALARAAAFEVGILAYLLFIWRRPEGQFFTYHRRNSPRLLLAIFLFLLVVETIGLHLLLSLWSPTIAWIATALSVYVGIQLVAHFKAISIRPIVVTDAAVLIRCGILGDVSIPRGSIESISGVDSSRSDGFDLLPLGGMSQPNLQVLLSQPVPVYGVYGTKRETDLIRINVDDPAGFMRAIDS